MAYSPGYSIDIRAGGDTVRGAFEKYNAEVVKIYGILNTLNDKDITAAELETLKTGSISGSRITGNIPASQVSGTLTGATIPTGNVTGLQSYVRGLISQSGSGSSYSITGLDWDYIKFSNGLMVQWGESSLIGSSMELSVTFSRSYNGVPRVIVSAKTAGSEAATVTLKSTSSTGFTVIFGQCSSSISRIVNFIAIGV